MAYGTLMTFDTLASQNNTVVAKIGEDHAFDAVMAALEAHNRIVGEMIGDFVERSTDRLRRFGGPANMVMDEIDEMGTPDAQKVSNNTNVGFPMRSFGGSLQWSRRWFQNKTGAELAAQVKGLMDADAVLAQREIKRALFRSTNFSFVDRNIESVTLPVKRLVNADGMALPVGPNAEVFNGATHTHYLGTASYAAADLTALISTVTEHFATGSPVVYINQAQEAATRAFTGFTAYLDARLIQANNVVAAPGKSLTPTNLYNRAIGIFNGAEVWVKPWIPASYVYCYVQGQAVPLVWRTREGGSGNLELVFEDEEHPLRAQTYEREFGVGVWNRINGAVLYTGNATYADPTLN